MDVMTDEVAGSGRALMFADDLALICESKEEAITSHTSWKKALQSKGLKVNTQKNKGLEVYEKGRTKKTCGVCGRRVGINSIRCKTCSLWVHRRCSGVFGSLIRASALFSCKTCVNGGRKGSGVFSSDGVDLECVGEFIYLDDVLNDGGRVE